MNCSAILVADPAMRGARVLPKTGQKGMVVRGKGQRTTPGEKTNKGAPGSRRPERRRRRGGRERERESEERDATDDGRPVFFERRTAGWSRSLSRAAMGGRCWVGSTWSLLVKVEGRRRGEKEEEAEKATKKRKRAERRNFALAR